MCFFVESITCLYSLACVLRLHPGQAPAAAASERRPQSAQGVLVCVE